MGMCDIAAGTCVSLYGSPCVGNVLPFPLPLAPLHTEISRSPTCCCAPSTLLRGCLGSRERKKKPSVRLDSFEGGIPAKERMDHPVYSRTMDGTPYSVRRYSLSRRTSRVARLPRNIELMSRGSKACVGITPCLMPSVGCGKFRSSLRPQVDWSVESARSHGERQR